MILIETPQINLFKEIFTLMFVQILECLGIYIGLLAVSLTINFIRSVKQNKALWSNIEDSWILITGGTDGIGKAICLRLAKMKKRIIVIGRNEEKLSQLKAECMEHVDDFETICADLGVPQDFEKLLPLDKQIGLVFNNAGLSHESPKMLIEEDSEYIQAMLHVNLVNATSLTQVVAKRSHEKHLYIVNTGSLLAEFTCPLYSVYSATKAYIKAFSMSLAYERKPKNFHVECLGIGLVSTKMSKVKKASFFGPDTATMARYIVKTIGTLEYNVPYPPHLFQYFISLIIPKSICNMVLLFMFYNIRKKALSKSKKK